LAVGLQAVTKVPKHAPHRARTDRMVLVGEFLRQAARTLAGPTQRCLRIATGYRFDQRIERAPQIRIMIVQRFAARTRTTYARVRLTVASLRFQFLNSGRNRGTRQARGLRNPTDTTPSKLTCFAGRPVTAHAFVHYWSQCLKLPTNPFNDR